MRRIRRDVEFAVDSSDGFHWIWQARLARDGQPLGGTISGSQAVALKACIAAIDEALSGSLLRVPVMTTH